MCVGLTEGDNVGDTDGDYFINRYNVHNKLSYKLNLKLTYH